MTPFVHKLPLGLAGRCLSVALIGAGGNGSQMASGLARLNSALRALGGDGLHVTIIDPDVVSVSNVGRQLFSPSDVGHAKATVLATRINLFFGTRWDAVVGRAGEVNTPGARFDFIVGCVDSNAARRDIRQLCDRQRMGYLLDLGNDRQSGQVVLGQVQADKGTLRLPLVWELFPSILDEATVEDDGPSCSVADALAKQDLFVNQATATPALALLWQLLRTGEIEHHGAFVNLRTGSQVPLPICPVSWARMTGSPSWKKTLAYRF